MRFLSVLCMALLAVFTTQAKAITLNISGTTSGCYGGPNGQACSNGAENLPAGALVNLINPVQLTLGPGTYSITNGATTGPFSGWRYNGGNNWVWNYGIAIDNGNGTGNIFHVAYAVGQFSTQAGIANSNVATKGGPGGPDSILPVLSLTGGPGAYLDQIILTQTLTLSFFVLDYYLPDNAGGVSLNISGGPSSVPLPAALPLLLAGLGGLGAMSRWRGRSRIKSATQF